MADLLMLLPVIGIVGLVFLTLGEPRYRTPFDGFLIILAAAFYARVISIFRAGSLAT